MLARHKSNAHTHHSHKHTPKTRSEDGISHPVKYPERERRFLGCVHVPLSAIYQMQCLEGTLRLEVGLFV